MKGMRVLLSIGAVALLFAATDSFAQKGPGMMWRGSGDWGPGTPYKGMGAGVHMTLNTGKETISVHLGPSWYLENQDVKIEAKDKVEVKGSKITFGGKPAIIAIEVKKGDEVLKLRDDAGFPVWSGWRRR